MAAPARFLFETDFAVEARRRAAPPPPTITVAEHEKRVAAAERAARAAGLAEGRAAAEARAAVHLAEEAGRLAAAVEGILAVLDAERARIEADSLRVAGAIARKLAGRLIEALPREAVLATFADALEPLRRAPHVVVRLAAEDSGAIGEAIGKVARERGFEGRIVVLGEPGVRRGDCRIEWADGGIVRDGAALDAAVAALVDAHIASLSPAEAADNPGADA